MTEWWEYVLAGVAVLAVGGAIFLKRRKVKPYERQFPEPPKQRPPGGRA